MATVVVVLPSTPAVLSVRRLPSVSGSSVRSGLISLTAPTSVVLPTPNPPASRILIARYWADLFGYPPAESETP
jgi:hypothetical protein